MFYYTSKHIDNHQLVFLVECKQDLRKWRNGQKKKIERNINKLHVFQSISVSMREVHFSYSLSAHTHTHLSML